jgi:hypothetical protein
VVEQIGWMGDLKKTMTETLMTKTKKRKMMGNFQALTVRKLTMTIDMLESRTVQQAMPRAIEVYAPTMMSMMRLTRQQLRLRQQLLLQTKRKPMMQHWMNSNHPKMTGSMRMLMLRH